VNSASSDQSAMATDPVKVAFVRVIRPSVHRHLIARPPRLRQAKRPAMERAFRSLWRFGPSDENRQTKNCPPLAEIVDPVMKPASSEARKVTIRAISSGSPRRPTGICGMIRSFSTFSSMARTISVPI